MAKLIPRFRVNVVHFRHTFKKQEEVNVTKQKQNVKKGTPAMPVMRWNKDGSPCYAHLEGEPPTETKKVKGKDGVEYFIAPRINWKEC